MSHEFSLRRGRGQPPVGKLTIDSDFGENEWAIISFGSQVTRQSGFCRRGGKASWDLCSGNQRQAHVIGWINGGTAKPGEKTTLVTLLTPNKGTALYPVEDEGFNLDS
jgi:hypothetical protein